MTVPATSTTVIGKIHSYPNNPRVAKALIAAAYNGLAIEQVGVEFGKSNKTPEFLAKFPLGKVPAFESADGSFALWESRAIASYVAGLKEGSTLLGKDKKESALIDQWLCFSDLELGPIYAAWIYPILGYTPPNESTCSKAKADARKILSVLDAHFLSRTFLVGESITIADITLVCHLSGMYKLVFDPEFRAPYINLNRWYLTCVNQPHFLAVLGKVELCDVMKVAKEAVKEKKVAPAPKKAAEVPAEAKEEEEPSFEDEKPKEKNPLDLLPKSPFTLDEWKRFYSNNDTRPTAIDWFWKNYDPAGYSIFKLDYKYNSELTLTFMSSNLVGGFFQRLESVRKYAFGNLLVCGKDNDNIVSGYFVFRGPEVPAEVKDCPDYESYVFTKVDEKDPKVREAFNGVLAWDLNINGKVFVDGKTFK